VQSHELLVQSQQFSVDRGSVDIKDAFMLIVQLHQHISY